MRALVPTMCLPRLLGPPKGTINKRVHAGRWGEILYTREGLQAVDLAELERVEQRKFSTAELLRAVVPPDLVSLAPPPMDPQLDTILGRLTELLDHKHAGFYSRQEVEAIVDHVIGRRDGEWMALQKRQMQTQVPDPDLSVPDRSSIEFEIEDREFHRQKNGDIL